MTADQALEHVWLKPAQASANPRPADAPAATERPPAIGTVFMEELLSTAE